MFERFTEQARRVLVLATREARLAGHESLDSGDLLVALAQERAGLAGRALADMASSTELVRANRLLGTTVVEPTDDAMTADAKLALQSAAEQAVSLTQPEVGTAHLLLGVLEDQDNRAGAVLREAGGDPDHARDAVLLLLKEGGRDGTARLNAPAPVPSRVNSVLLATWRPGLEGEAATRLARMQPALDAADAAEDRARRWALVDWLVRTATPQWLRGAGLDEAAQELAGLAPVESPAAAMAAGAVIDLIGGVLAASVPGSIPSAARDEIRAALDTTRAAAGEMAAATAVTADLAEPIVRAARNGVTRSMADLLLGTRQDDVRSGIWTRAILDSRIAAEIEGQHGAGRRPAVRTSAGTGSGASARMMALRALRTAAGPVALPITLIEAGVRSAKLKREKDQLDNKVTRAAVAACTAQLIDDAAWLVIGQAGITDGARAGAITQEATAPTVMALQQSLLDLLDTFAAE